MNLLNEKLLSLREARSLPFLRGRRGRRPDLSTIYRWALHGARGRRLETVLIGGSRFTSEQAVMRFVTQGTQGTKAQEPHVPASFHADKLLDADGF